jgi:ketosteroid isomerase-like protein
LAGLRQGRAGRTTGIAFRDIQIRTFGDIAIVTGINETEGAGARSAGDRADLKLRFTQVWRWANGGWLREAFEATPISAEAAS